MTSPITYAVDDKDLDDAALWAVIDSAAAASLSSSAITSTTITNKHRKPLIPIPTPSPQYKLSKTPKIHHHQDYNKHNYASPHGEVLQNHRPHKIPRTATNTPCVSELIETSPDLLITKHVQRTPTTPPVYKSPEISSPVGSECSPVSYGRCEDRDRQLMTHSLCGRFPTVSLFKEYQNAAMAILEKTDYTVISGNPYIKKSGWRKISFYFNLSYEIKDKTIEFDENRNVQRAEFIVRAYMQGGRFSDGWGSCERREKRFLKPNHDIPSTAETRAKNKACQDLLGIGEYRPGASHAPG